MSVCTGESNVKTMAVTMAKRRYGCNLVQDAWEISGALTAMGTFVLRLKNNEARNPCKYVWPEYTWM